MSVRQPASGATEKARIGARQRRSARKSPRWAKVRFKIVLNLTPPLMLLLAAVLLALSSWLAW